MIIETHGSVCFDTLVFCSRTQPVQIFQTEEEKKEETDIQPPWKKIKKTWPHHIHTHIHTYGGLASPPHTWDLRTLTRTLGDKPAVLWLKMGIMLTNISVWSWNHEIRQEQHGGNPGSVDVSWCVFTNNGCCADQMRRSFSWRNFNQKQLYIPHQYGDRSAQPVSTIHSRRNVVSLKHLFCKSCWQ